MSLNGKNVMHDRGSKPYGMPWEEWAVLWWKWCSLEPDDTNPSTDATGINCSRKTRLINTPGFSLVNLEVVRKDIAFCLKKNQFFSLLSLTGFHT